MGPHTFQDNLNASNIAVPKPGMVSLGALQDTQKGASKCPKFSREIQ